MNLFLLVWTMEDWDEPEWTQVVSEKEYLDNDDQEKYVKEFMLRCHELTPKDYTTGNIWSNRLDKVDEYKVTLEKA